MLKNCHLLPQLYKGSLQVTEKFTKVGINRPTKVSLGFANAHNNLSVAVGFGPIVEAKLYEELLKPSKIEFVNFSPVQYLHIDVSDDAADFGLRSVGEKAVILQKFSQFDSSQSFLALDVVLDGLKSMTGVHRGAVVQKDVS